MACASAWFIIMADALVAVLTPPGSAAVATVAVVGMDAWPIVRSLFRRFGGPAMPVEPDFSRHWTGEFGGPPGDTVVLSARRQSAASWIEIHSHGGPAVVRWLLAELSQAGCTVCAPDEIADRAGHSNLRNEAAWALTRAPTARIAGILLDQVHGSLEVALTEVVAALQRRDLADAKRRLDEVLQYADIGRHLISGWRVAVCGAPNVGKSSLINRLAGYARCIVTPIPGTTRDAVAVSIAVDGWPVQLIDTAGQRSTVDPLERSGIELAQAEMASADLTIWLTDAASANQELPPLTSSTLVVANKIDLVVEPPTGCDAAISATTGQGIDNLLAMMSLRLAPQVPSARAAVPFSGRLVDALAQIARSVSANEIPRAITALKSLTGDREVSSPQI